MHLPAPAQTAIVIAAIVVFGIILVGSIARALRPRPPVEVPPAPPVVDPNALNEGLPTDGAATASEPASEPASAAPAVSGVSERGTPETPATPAPAVTAQVGQDGDSEFVRLWPHQLAKITVVAQALDSQWLTRKMLAQMRRSFAQQPMGLASLQAERRKAGRAEYMRALLNSQQLVANRVFLYNTDYVVEDFMQAGETRSAFVELLNQGVIVPYLFNEHSPSQAPTNVEKLEDVFTAWRQICREARVRGVRLDWDDALNAQATKQLSGRFGLWLITLSQIKKYGDIGVLAAQVGLTPEQIPAFQARLRDVSQWADQQEDIVYRGAFYKEFIAAPDTAIPDGIIDFDANRKPFASELKQLADLSYATNLPDALGRYALTPMDSLPRTALQELNITFGQVGRVINEQDINTLLQREAFGLMNEGLFLKSMEHLTLRDVIELRATDEWAAYTSEMEGLLDHPLDFTQRSRLVSQRYITLAERMTERARRRSGDELLERWSPVVKLVLTVGTSSLSLWGNPFGAGLGSKILYSVSEGAVGQFANLTARMIIGGVADRRTEAELETSLDFLRGRVDGAQDAWRDIIGKLRSDPEHFEDRTGQPDRSDDEFDPNINYQEQIEGSANG